VYLKALMLLPVPRWSRYRIKS